MLSKHMIQQHAIFCLLNQVKMMNRIIYVCICKIKYCNIEVIRNKCDCLSKTQPSSHSVIFQEIPIQNIQLIKATCSL